ncbi:MAG TPA: peptidase MA family metallohydrolase [Planctomycetota bacterium]|nr:peptidase MA family metallohydrolase [Planctomycetota bacterium]
MKRLFIILCLFLLVLPAAAEELNRASEAPGVIVRYSDGGRNWAARTLKLFPHANEQALSSLGIAANRRVSIHLYQTTAGFQNATRFKLPDTLGVAIPSANLIVIDCSKTEIHGPNNLALTLKHEMVHIAFGRVENRSGHRVPLWFNEGVACWLSGRVYHGEQVHLTQAVNTDSLFPLSEIAGGFPTARYERELAYQQSEAAVRFIVSRYGSLAIKQIVRLMEQGQPFEKALGKVTMGVDFEAALKDHLRQEYPVFALLRTIFSLFTMMAFLAILAWVIYRIRRRRTMREWKKEEESIYTDDYDY